MSLIKQSTMAGVCLLLLSFTTYSSLAQEKTKQNFIQRKIADKRIEVLKNPIPVTEYSGPGEKIPKNHKDPHYAQTLSQFLKLPGEQAEQTAKRKASGSWQPIGNGIYDGSTPSRHGLHRTGRANSFRFGFDPDGELKTFFLGSRAAGLWKWVDSQSQWYPISWNLEGSPAVGAFWVDPEDSDYIVMGTGEVRNQIGTGVYITQDGGASWAQADTGGINFTVTYAIEADKTQTDLLMMATSRGLFRSDDKGQSWRRVYTNGLTDLVQNEENKDQFFTGGPNVGFLAYDTAADQMVVMSNIGPLSSVGRVYITQCRDVPEYVFMLVTNGGTINGIYRNDSAGTGMWQLISSRDIAWGQGGHTGALTVHPENPDLLFVGMGGFEWTKTATKPTVSWIEKYAIGHDDYTSMTMDASGETLIVTNDGGIYMAALQDMQTYPHHQFAPFTEDTYNITGGLNLQELLGARGTMDAHDDLMLAGLQDNGVVAIDLNPSGRVDYLAGGDGLQVYIKDPMTFGVSYGGPPFARYRSIDGGATFSGINCNLPNAMDAYLVPASYHGHEVLFTHSKRNLYWRDASWSCDKDWKVFNKDPLPTDLVQMEVVEAHNGEYLFFLTDGQGKLWFLETGFAPFGQIEWEERTPPEVIDANRQPEKAVISPEKLWAGIEGIYFTTADRMPARAFFSADKGQSWREVTGSVQQVLPNAAFWELVADPRMAPDTFFLATNVGILRTDDGGLHWYRYMDGLPKVVDIATIELSMVDPEQSAYEIIVGTKGAGFFKRSLVLDEDDYAPTGEITSPDGQCIGQTVPLAVAVDDASGISSVVYRIYDAAGNQVQSYSGNGSNDFKKDGYVGHLQDGFYSVDAVVSDTMGNEITLHAVGFEINQEPPTVTMLEPHEGLTNVPWVTSPRNFVLRGEAAANSCPLVDVYFSAHYRDADGVFRDHRLPNPILLSDGTYQLAWDVSGVPDQHFPTIPYRCYVELIAVDEGGNSMFSTAWLLGFDRQAPDVAWTLPNADATTNANTLDLKVDGQDLSVLGHWLHRLEVVAQYRPQLGQPVQNHVLFDQNQAVTWQGSLDMSIIPDQTIALIARAYDAAGNVSEVTRLMTLDRTAPSVSSHSFAPDPFLADGSSTATLSYTVDSTCEVSIVFFDQNGQDAGVIPSRSVGAGTHSDSWDGKDKFGNLPPAGIYDYHLHVADSAGNFSTLVGSFSLTRSGGSSKAASIPFEK